MKRLIITTTVAVLVLTGLLSFKSNYNTFSDKGPSMQETTSIPIPADVQAILDRSCLPCHGADGNFMAKGKWNYEKMPEMTTSKLISRLSKIISKVEKGKMPTRKFIKKNPDKKLTETEKEALIGWADGLAESLTN